MILDKTLKRIRQILAEITLRKKQRQKEERLMLSWQTRSLAMVIAASGNNDSSELKDVVSSLTIDNEEYKQFSKEQPKAVKPTKKLPVHATTQEQATQANFDAAADRNNFDMLALFGDGMTRTPPGQ